MVEQPSQAVSLFVLLLGFGWRSKPSTGTGESLRRYSTLNSMRGLQPWILVPLSDPRDRTLLFCRIAKFKLTNCNPCALGNHGLGVVRSPEFFLNRRNALVCSCRVQRFPMSPPPWRYQSAERDRSCAPRCKGNACETPELS